MVRTALNLMEFFAHETCGKCSPCREGSSWLVQMMRRIEHGHGKMEDLDHLVRICGGIAGKTVCAFGDAEVAPILSTLKHWRAEYEFHIKEKKCMVGSRGGQLVAIGDH